MGIIKGTVCAGPWNERVRFDLVPLTTLSTMLETLALNQRIELPELAN